MYFIYMLVGLVTLAIVMMFEEWSQKQRKIWKERKHGS